MALENIHTEFIVSFCFICLVHCVPNTALAQWPIVVVMSAVSLWATWGQYSLHYSSHCSPSTLCCCGVCEWPSLQPMRSEWSFSWSPFTLKKKKKLILRFILKPIVLQGAGPNLNTLHNANIPYNINGMSHYIITIGLHLLLRYSVDCKNTLHYMLTFITGFSGDHC